MRYQNVYMILMMLGLFLLVAPTLSAQDDAEQCPAIVDEALTAADTNCSDLGRNEICYGHIGVDATDADDLAITGFTTAGDILGVDRISRISTAGLNLDTNTWGVALLSLQANIPDTIPGQNVLFVVFGEASLEAETDSNFGAPMQAFRMTTGIGRSRCAGVPQDGVLVQSPADIEVNFQVNGVDIQMGSTLFLTQVDDNPSTLRVTVIEGQATVTANGQSQAVEAGFSVDVADSSAPTETSPIDAESVADVPVDLLPEAVAIPFTLIASEATVAWVDSGIPVEAGQTYQISATGQTNLWPQCSEFCQDNDEYACADLCTAIAGGPAGTVPVTDVVASSDPFFVLPGERFLVLLARIGDGDPFIVGADYLLEAEDTGNLFFRINEDTRVAGDEPGAYAVSVLAIRSEGDDDVDGGVNDDDNDIDDDTDDDDDNDDDED